MKISNIKHLQVSTPQGVSGDLFKESRYVFNYTSSAKETEASIALPFRNESYGSGDLFSVFAMNRPEGFLLDRINERFGKFGVVDNMALLKITGHNQIGRISYTDPNDPVSRKASNMRLKDILQAPSSEELFEYLVNEYLDSGISGFQPKTMVSGVIDYPTERISARTDDLIVKMASYEFPQLAANEFLCMSVARTAGLQTPDSWLSDDGGMFVVRRFDVMNGERQGLEDIMTLANMSNKYHGSYEGIAKILSTICSDPQQSLEQFFAQVALSVSVRNGDAHLKNFSVLYQHPGADISLSPVYDVVTTAIYNFTNARGMNVADRSMALKLNKSKAYPTKKELVAFGRTCLVIRPEDILDRIEDAKLQVIRDNKDRFDREFIGKMCDAWDIKTPTYGHKYV